MRNSSDIKQYADDDLIQLKRNDSLTTAVYRSVSCYTMIYVTSHQTLRQSTYYGGQIKGRLEYT